MEEKKSSFGGKAKGFWSGLNKTLKILIIAVLSALLVVVVYLAATAGKVEYEVLQTGLSPKEAADATAILGDLSIPYKVSGVNNVTIEVPKGTRSRVLIQMQSEGYPASDADLYGFYTENAGGLGVTDQDRHMYEKFATEQRLAFLIKQLEKVENATVMVSLAQKSQFALSGEDKPAQASVVLTLKSDMSLTDAEAETVRSIVVDGVAGLQPENVTIADAGMRVYRYQNAENGGGMMVSDQIALKQQHQQLIQEQVYNFLTPVFGAGNITVSASVELDFDKKSTQSVTYAPPGDEDNMGIIVSLQQAAERAGAQTTAAGVAGFDANGAAPFYPEDLGGETAPVFKYTQQLNAEVNEVREQIEEAQGKITSLSVSVMIDAGEAWDEELENVRSLVANGLGVDEKYISVMRTSFKVNEDYQQMLAEQAAAEEALASAQSGEKASAILLVAAAAVALLLILIIVMALRGRSRRLAYEAELARIEQEREMEAQKAMEAATLREKIVDGGADDASASRLKDVQSLAKDKPEMVAQLLRNWLTDDYGRR